MTSVIAYLEDRFLSRTFEHTQYASFFYVLMTNLEFQIFPSTYDGGELRGMGSVNSGRSKGRARSAAVLQRGARARREPAGRAPPARRAAGPVRLDRRRVVSTSG